MQLHIGIDEAYGTLGERMAERPSTHFGAASPGDTTPGGRTSLVSLTLG
jgi:hypothetical protein